MWRVAWLRVLRLSNPLVRLVLESSAHPLLSGRLLLLTYRGHRSGREFRIPLRYAETPAGELVALAVRPAGKDWWRSFAPAGPATLVVRRASRAAEGALAVGERRETARSVYLGRYPRSAKAIGDAAIVVFTLRDG